MYTVYIEVMYTVYLENIVDRRYLRFGGGVLRG